MGKEIGKWDERGSKGERRRMKERKKEIVKRKNKWKKDLDKGTQRA